MDARIAELYTRLAQSNRGTAHLHHRDKKYDCEFRYSPHTVSVVIPAYNAEAVLPRALESVFQQTHPVEEVIVVNDGSRDRTAEVMASYGAKIIGIHTDNRGAAAARNSGIQRATSHWIAFLDADDEWHADKMERQWRH